MALLMLTLACASSPPAPPSPDAAPAQATPEVRTIDVDTLAQDLEAGSVSLLLDVRTPEEFAAGHVPAAVNLPLSELAARSEAALLGHEGAEIYLVCQSGGRSARAAAQLSGQGVRTVNVQGGTRAWISAGRAVDK